MTKVSGYVFEAGTKSRQVGAVVKATSAENMIFSTTSDDHGVFAFNDLPPGKWTCVGLKEGYYSSEPQTFELAVDPKEFSFKLERITDKVDEKFGKIFFYVLLGVFVGLIVLYLLSHRFITSPPGSFKFWSEDPLRYLEILLWGLAGILVSKIITTGLYLRTHRFYREGIFMHIAHLVATPVLVLVTVLLLSTVTFKFTLTGSNEITIDLSDPRIMVAFAFIIGTSPWPLWNFIQDAAKRFTGKFE